jgi:hypothetical protein
MLSCWRREGSTYASLWLIRQVCNSKTMLPSLKGLGHQTGIFLKAYKIKSVLSVHEQTVHEEGFWQDFYD